MEDLKIKIFALQLENRNLKHYRGKYEAIRVVKDRKATKEQLQKTVVELRCEIKEMETKAQLGKQPVGPILLALHPGQLPAPLTVGRYIYDLKAAAFGDRPLEVVQQILRD